MDERIKITLSVSAETNKRIKEIGARTHRADSHVVDWLVEAFWQSTQTPASVSVETVSPTAEEAVS